jgi:two-component system, OmpR family, sensor histidine kinase MtrB
VNLTLRAKAILVGCLVAVMVTGIASLATYGIAQRFLLNQRESVAVSQTYSAARQVARGLADGQDPFSALIAGSRALPSARALLQIDDEWLVSGVGVSPRDIPTPLLTLSESGTPGRQRANTDSTSYLFTALPIIVPQHDRVTFVGVTSFSEFERSLFVLRFALVAGVALAAIGGGFVGRWLSHRVSEPLHDVSMAAAAISSGDISTRIPEPKEDDLAAIARSFNLMAETLESRFKRDAQFAAHVSHELRSPLTVIKNAAEMLADRREELGERARLSVDMLTERVAAFEKILADLLEISRYETNTIASHVEVLNLARLLETLATRHNLPADVAAVERLDPNVEIDVDARRFAYCYKNLVENAELYAKGLVAIRVDVDHDRVDIHFDDAGPGIDPDQRQTILQPFIRGTRTSSVRGSGLGLAIVSEHMRVMHGSLTVGESPEGGARFTLSLRRGEYE